jgi:hypothetical protein
VIVDALDAESECVESNNDRVEPVTAGATQPDLVLTLGNATNMCPPSVATTVTNQGTAPAPAAVVRYYAGNPQQGGSPIFEITVPGPIAPGQSVNVMPAPTLTGFPGGALDITVYGIVDPDKLIPECNDANNGDAANNAVSCAPQ